MDGSRVQLGVNIDHVATVRNARYPGSPDVGESGAEPDPVRAAHEAELGGADSVTVHLREDRRHIVDRDVALLRSLLGVRLNLEMAATDEMVSIARDIGVHTAMLVPEGRAEVTTEGGLDLAGLGSAVEKRVSALRDAGITVSAFIDADASQVEAAASMGFAVCELHTGPYAAAFRACGGDERREALRVEIDKVRETGALVVERGMRMNAGHALNYANTAAVAALPGVSELHIGHAIVSRAVFVGLRDAVREMRRVIEAGSARS